MISNAFAFQNKDFLLDAQKTFSIQQREMQRYYHCSFSLLTKEIIMSSLLWRDYYKMWDMSENKWYIYIYLTDHLLRMEANMAYKKNCTVTTHCKEFVFGCLSTWLLQMNNNKSFSSSLRASFKIWQLKNDPTSFTVQNECSYWDAYFIYNNRRFSFTSH